MAKFITLTLLAAFALLCLLGLFYIKDAYRLLPLGASKEGAPGQFTAWRKFDSQTGGFNVMMPAVPQQASQNISDPKTKETRHYDMFVAQKAEGTMFMVSLIKFSSNAGDLLKKTVINDLLASNPQNQLQDMKVGNFEGFETLDFTITNSNTVVQGFTFVDGNTLYLISAVFPVQYYSASEYDYFVKSFHLEKAKAK